MKTTNIALHAVLAVIGTASRASAKGFFRGSVEKKEDVRRGTMGDQVSKTYLDKCADGKGLPGCETCGDLIAVAMSTEIKVDAKGLAMIGGNKGYMEACYKVSEANDACVGCQGYELEGDLSNDPTNGMIHIPGCINMDLGACQAYAREILANHPEWFPDGTNLLPLDQRQVTSVHDMAYNKLAMPVKGNPSTQEEAASAEVAGLAGNCLVHYPWTWCTEINTGNVHCELLNPFDCAVNEYIPVSKDNGCLNTAECCARINGDGDRAMARYAWPDINGNKLECYAWVTVDTTASGGDGTGTGTGPGTGTGTGDTNPGPSESPLRLIVHLNHKLVALPAIITGRKDFVVEADNGIQPVYEEDNLHKWVNGVAVATESIEMVEVNNAVYYPEVAQPVLKDSGYHADDAAGGAGAGAGGAPTTA